MDSRHWRFKNWYLIFLLYSFIAANLVLSYNLIAQEIKKSENLFPSAIVGIWKECYHPELKEAYEIDGGYLILNPDGSYIRMNNNYVWEGIGLQSVQSGTYKIDGRSVIFHKEKSFRLKDSDAETFTEEGGGSKYKLIFESNVKIVFFDAIEKPVIRTVLHGKGSLNYGYAKIY